MQVALRWLYEQGVCMVARSFNEGRMKQNMDIFDWELSDQDKAMIAGVPQRRACHGNYFVSPDGPYKSLHDLWDGEIWRRQRLDLYPHHCAGQNTVLCLYGSSMLGHSQLNNYDGVYSIK